MKIQPRSVASLLLALIILQVSAVAIGSVDKDGAQALIVEYIPQYRVKVNDLKSVIENQLSKITIGTVKTAYATIDKASFTFTYKNGSVPKYVTPVKVEVANDSYTINFNFTVTVLHIVGKKTYECQFSLNDPIIVNYTKQVNLASGQTEISQFNTNFGPAAFSKNATCTSKPTDKDAIRIHEIVSGTESSSIYLQLKKVVSKIRGDMQDNIQTQHLSQIFMTNPYHYEYYEYKVDVNVSTIATERFGDVGLVNKMRGSIPGATHFIESIPSYQQGYNLFFTKQFMQNMIQDSIKNNPRWRNIIANRTNMRTSSFRFRLIDYQYIVPSILKKYPKAYLQDTQISCSAKSYRNMKIYPGDNITVEFTWNCMGSLMVSNNSSYNFINFEPTILYGVTFDVRSKDYLTVYEKAVKVVDLNFNIIDGHAVEDFTTVKIVIEDGLFEFQGYPIGGFFKVKEGSSQVKLAEEGLWVG